MRSKDGIDPNHRMPDINVNISDHLPDDREPRYELEGRVALSISFRVAMDGYFGFRRPTLARPRRGDSMASREGLGETCHSVDRENSFFQP